MKQNTFDKKDGMLKKHSKKKFWKKVVVMLSCVTVFCTSYTMIMPAMTMSETTYCGQEEGENHTHTLQCYSNPNADLETEANWTATIPTLTGNWNEDVVAVANSQLGYQESTANYQVADNNEKKGYNRYGAWMNEPYADWNTDFVLFCLHYANVDTNSLSLSNDLSAWASNSAYVTKDSYTPKAGDLIILDENNDGSADHAAIITEANGSAIKIVEGDYNNAVGQENYDTTDARVIGYIQMPQNPAMQTAEETAESTETEETAVPEETAAPEETAQPEPTTAPEATEPAETAVPQETVEPEMTAAPEESSAEAAVPAAPSASKRMMPKIFRAADNSGRTNLSNYITSITAEKKNNGQWEDATEFTDGDNARFTINYTVHDNKLQKGDKLTYQLDQQHICIQDDTEGDVRNNDGDIIGRYSITKAGLITIDFNEDKDVTQAFSGMIRFSGDIKIGQSTGNESISFGANDSFTIKPAPQSDNTDLSITKKGEYDTQKHQLNYTITISTNNGTDSDINLRDQITAGLEGEYLFDNLSVTKTDKEKNSQELKGYSWIKKENSYSLNQTLPALKAGEHYTIRYTVTPDQNQGDDGFTLVDDGSRTVTNIADAWTNKHNSPVWNSVPVRGKRVEKNGRLQEDTKSILWTVTIHNEDQSDITAHTYQDTMKNITDNNSTVSCPKTMAVQVTNPISDTIYYANVDEKGNITFPSDLPKNEKEYQITYQTPFSDVIIHRGEKSAKVENTFTEDNKYTAKDQEEIGNLGVTKWFENQNVQVQDGSTTLLQWSARISYPDNVNDLAGLTYTDTMSMKHGDQEKDGLHYTTPELLKNGLTVWNDTATFTYDEDYQITDSQGKPIDDLPDDTHLSEFKVIFINTRYVIPKKSDISLRYQTIGDFREQHTSEMWSAVNKGNIPDYPTEKAHFDYTKPVLLNKQSSPVDRFAFDDGRNIGEYKDDGVVVDYHNQYIYYRVVFTVPEQNDTITLTDTLPAGLTFDSEYSIKARINYDDQFGVEPTLSVDSEPLPDGSSKVKFSIQKNCENMKYSYYTGNKIYLYYRAKIQDKEFWNQNKDLSKTYLNHIQMGNLSDISETTVQKKEKILNKTSTVSETAPGNYAIDYQLCVNPYGNDLDPKSNTLLLSDNLSINKSDSEAVFDPSALKVYQYDASKDDKIGQELNQNRYTVQFDSKSHKLVLTVPDSLALVVKYKYNFTVGANDTTVSNSASLNGVAGGSSSKSNTLKTTDSGATAYRKVVKICKVDSDNIKIKLQGVSFKLEEFTPDNGKWESVNTKTQLVTNENGEISLNEIQEGLKDDTVYRLTETDVGKENAEKGYELSDQSYYFVWKSKAHLKEDNYKYFSELPNTQTLTNTFHITSSQIQFMNYSGTIYVPNVKHALTVNKVWVDSNGKDIVNPQKTATVRLMRSFHEQVNVILNIKDLKNSNGDGYTNYTLTAKVYKNDPNARIIIFGWHRDQKYGSLYLADTGKELDWIQTDPNSPWEIYPYYNVGSIDSDLTIDLNASIEWDKPGQLSVKVTGSDDITSSLKSETAKDASGNEIAPVVLSNENGWSYTWKNLPAVDANGQTYYYYVVEDEVSGYTTSYDNNEGIERGTITVTNKKDATQDYELPDTGGTGTVMIYVAGGVLVAVAVVMLVMQKRKKS